TDGSRGAAAPAAVAGLAALPAAPAPALRIGTPKPVADGRYLSTWAPIRERAPARARPDAAARVVARVGLRTPEATTNPVRVLGRLLDARGRVWVRVGLAVLPNGTTGWLPRAALGAYEQVRTHLVVDRARLTATLYRDGRVVFRAPVGVGKPSSPTPAGTFMVRNRLTGYASPMYGPLAFGTTARSAVLTEWPAGRFVGLHATRPPP